MANDIVLETRGLVKKFGDAVILNGIDFTLHDKEVAVILGPSGCGTINLTDQSGCLAGSPHFFPGGPAKCILRVSISVWSC